MPLSTVEISRRLAEYWGDGAVDVDPSTGVLTFANSPTNEHWDPTGNPDLSGLEDAMAKIGLDVDSYSFQNYEVHGGQTGKPGHDQQLGVVGTSYRRPHQTDLVLRSPDVAAQEIKAGSTPHKDTTDDN